MYTLEQFKIDYQIIRSKAIEANVSPFWVNLLNECKTDEQLLEKLEFAEILYYYTRYIVKGRVPEFEETIGGNPRWAYLYARDVAKCRIPEFEGVIGSKPMWAYYYAKDVAKNRILKFEEVISTDPKWFYCYIKDALNNRL